MNWNKVNSEVGIPWHKVLVYDGANTMFGYLQQIVNTRGNIELRWQIVPDYEEDHDVFIVSHWAEIEKPKD